MSVTIDGGTGSVALTATASGASLDTNLVLPTGTANGVAYLNGSKVLTTGSALTFDGTNFATTGSGTLKNLLLSGGTLPGAGNPSIALRSSDNVIYHQSGSANTIVMLDSAQNTMQSIGATAQIWNISNTEQMRLTSTGLGIGTSSPGYKLSVATTTDHVGLYDTDITGLVHVLSGNGNSSLYIGADNGNVAASSNLIFGVDGTERGRFNATGALVLQGGNTSANGVGITFPATQSASSDANTLDDYEEGTWTPTSANVTFSSATGYYTKIGRVVQFACWITFPSTADVNAAVIGGLPFTCANADAARAGAAVSYCEYTTAVTANVNKNSTNIFIYKFGGTTPTNADFSSKIVAIGGTYVV